jgi:hypothetical protein
MRHRVAARIHTMLVIVVLLAGCGADGAVRSDDGTGAVVTPGAVGVFDAKVGDCFSDELPTDQVTQVTNVDAVPCDQPHTNEVFAVFDLPDGEYPGDDAVSRQSEEGCVERFADFVGADYQSSRLVVNFLLPTRQSWDVQDDREVVCAISDPSGPLEGSVADTGEQFALPDVGDCVDDQGLPVPCRKRHHAEIYRVFELKGEAYPGADKVNARAERRCVKAFEGYVGRPWRP